MQNGARIKNLEEFQRKMHKRLVKDAPNKISKALGRCVLVVRNEAITSIASGAKTGEVYEKYNPRRTHRASAKGQAPATDTGTLISGITVSVEEEGKNLVGKIMAYASDGSGGNYAKHLEFGTSNMGERPFLVPALSKSSKQIVKIFKSEGVLRR